MKKYSHIFFFLAKEVNRLYGINYHISIYIRIDICQGEATLIWLRPIVIPIVFMLMEQFFFPLPISIKSSKFLYEIEKEEEEKRRLCTDHNTTLINYNNLEDD